MSAPDASASGSQGPSTVSTIALASAALAALLPPLGIAGIQLDALPPMTGFMIFAGGCALGGIVTLVLGLIALFVTRGGGDPQGRRMAWAATVLGGGLVLLLAASGSGGSGLPPINDITTNLDEPPSFAGDPADRGRDMSYPADFVPQVREAYPDLQSMRVNDAPAKAFARVEATAEQLGWEITRSDAVKGELEASDTTRIFKFVDDVVVRVRPSLVGSEIDLRSKSRDGRGDIGANAARIRAFVSAYGR